MRARSADRRSRRGAQSAVLVVNVLLAAAVMCTFPLMLLPAIQIMDRLPCLQSVHWLLLRVLVVICVAVLAPI